MMVFNKGVIPMYQIDDKLYLSEDEKKLVLLMRKRSWNPLKNDEKFMYSVASRATFQTGNPVRYDTHKNFIKDLTDAGLIIKITRH